MALSTQKAWVPSFPTRPAKYPKTLKGVWVWQHTKQQGGWEWEDPFKLTLKGVTESKHLPGLGEPFKAAFQRGTLKAHTPRLKPPLLPFN